MTLIWTIVRYRRNGGQWSQILPLYLARDFMTSEHVAIALARYFARKYSDAVTLEGRVGKFEVVRMISVAPHGDPVTFLDFYRDHPHEEE
jgi:hypothetical protein